MKTYDLKLEINSNHIDKTVLETIPGYEPLTPILGESASKSIGVMITPPIDEDYWLARVKVSDNQAIVCFYKFSTIGVGFQKESDWNTNLPYTCETDEIYDHIQHNRGGPIPRAKCLQAIKMLQELAGNIMESEQKLREAAKEKRP